LTIELKSVKISRDQFQSENAQLKKQIASYQRQLKKAA
jgi:FtsZ-binding cell division protein ZapB